MFTISAPTRRNSVDWVLATPSTFILADAIHEFSVMSRAYLSAYNRLNTFVFTIGYCTFNHYKTIVLLI